MKRKWGGREIVKVRAAHNNFLPTKKCFGNTFQVVDGRLLVLLRRRHPAEVVAAVALAAEVRAGGVHDL